MTLERFTPILNTLALIFTIVVLSLLEYSTHMFTELWNHFGVVSDPFVRLFMALLPIGGLLVWIMIIVFQYQEQGYFGG